MCAQFSTPELVRFHDVKAAFDPDTLLNPGKAVPELHRCAEWGAMHMQRRATAASGIAEVLMLDAPDRAHPRRARQRPRR